MSSEDALMFDVLRPNKATLKSNLACTNLRQQPNTYQFSQPAHPKTERLPLQDAPALGNFTACNSYKDDEECSNNVSGCDARWHTMSMDCDVGDGNDEPVQNSIDPPQHPFHQSLDDTCEQAKATAPAIARMGLPASSSGQSVASTIASESSYEDDSELSRSLESAGNFLPATPARGTFPGQLAMFHSDETFQPGGDESKRSRRHDSASNCSPRSDSILTCSPLSRDIPHASPSSPRLASTTMTTLTAVGAGCKGASKLKSGTNAPLTASPLSGRVNLPHVGEKIQQSAPGSSSNTSTDLHNTHEGTSPDKLILSGPSNLAARRKLPSLAIRSANSTTLRFSKSSMPHTPGGSIFPGARDGAATGDDLPVSPFLPPTPFVVARGDNDRPSGYLSTPSRTILPPSRKPSSLPDVHTGFPSSPLLRQGSLGPLSPLSRDFAAVSVQGSSYTSQCGSSSTTTSSQDSANTSLTSMTPPMSPLTTGTSKQADLQMLPHSPSRLGVSRPKLFKSKSANRVAPYPNREMSLGASVSSSPQGSSETKNSIDALRLSPDLSILHGQSMEKSLSTPQQQIPEPKTVSGKFLSTRSLHPVFTASYTLGDELGSGGFGFVVGAHRNFDGRPVAVKFIWKNKVPSHGWVRDPTMGVIPLEAFVLRVVDHPCVVKFIDLFDDDEFFYLVMEMHGTPWQAPEAGEPHPPFKSSPASVSPASPEIAIFPPSDVQQSSDLSISTAARSTPDSLTIKAPVRKAALAPPRPAPMERRTSRDLFECIEQHTRFSEDVAAWIFAQIVEAVYYLGQLGICHRDIKDENCVIDADWNVKIIDFGSAVISDPRKPAPYFDRFFGTMTFASSEILQGRQYRAPHAEVWSLGVLLSILLSGECPFSEPSAAVKGRISSRVKSSWSTEAYNLLCGCVQVDPDRRATIAQVRDHPWVRRAWERKGLRRPSAPQIF